MFDRIAPTYDTLNHVMSAGVDVMWRTQVARSLPDPCGRVLDLCAGTLDLGATIRKEHPSAELVCADFATEMLRRGEHKLPGAPLVGADALHLPFQDGSFDAVVCGFGVRNVADLEACFREVARVLKPGGVFAVLEFFRPERAVTKLFHSLYNRHALPTLGAAISGDRAAYQYLADSMERFFSLEEAKALMGRCGYRSAAGQDLFFGVASILRGVRE
jgi:ubiquinone/menaquinone biosynthesis methyltransferase